MAQQSADGHAPSAFLCCSQPKRNAAAPMKRCGGLVWLKKACGAVTQQGRVGEPAFREEATLARRFVCDAYLDSFNRRFSAALVAKVQPNKTIRKTSIAPKAISGTSTFNIVRSSQPKIR